MWNITHEGMRGIKNRLSLGLGIWLRLLFVGGQDAYSIWQVEGFVVFGSSRVRLRLCGWGSDRVVQPNSKSDATPNHLVRLLCAEWLLRLPAAIPATGDPGATLKCPVRAPNLSAVATYFCLYYTTKQNYSITARTAPSDTLLTLLYMRLRYAIPAT